MTHGHRPLRTICVYLGSNPGRDPRYAEGARDLAHALTDRGLGLVYGGGNVGLMGILAGEVLARGGSVDGVIPRFMTDRELAHTGVTRLHVVESMHERKALMADLADAFITFPGGMGTLEELTETTTWAQLELHAKPIGILNLDGYYDPFLAMLDRAVEAGFLKPAHRDLLWVESTAGSLLDRLAGAAHGA